MKKKWLSILLCIVMITGLFSNSTIAFLTDTDSDANVMTVGNVHIQQIEEQRDAAGNLVEFKQEKPMYPAHYLDQEIPLDSYLNGHENEEAWKIYAANDYVVDKFITVENTGKSDAYVRTILAFERSEHERGREYVHLNYNDIENEVRWEWVAEKLNLGGVMYDVAVATYLKPLSKGEITLPSLKQLYMDKQADNDYYAAFGDRYEIKVLSQTAQAAGFDDADAALNGAFGVLDAANLTELLGGLQYEEQPESEYVVSVANESELAEAIENIANGVYPAGTVVKLSSDIALDKTLEIPASVTAVLDLESYTLTVEPAATGRLFGMRIAYAADWWKDIGNAIRNFGKLTLRGNKTDTPNARGILNKDNGELIIESGYFMQALQNAYAVWNDNGSLTIKDAAIIKHDGEKPETSDEPAPSAVLSTGSDSTVSVTGGEITGQYGALNVQEGKADVTGGKLQVTDETEGVVVNVADTANKVCISGGNLIAGTDENKESGSVTVNGGVAEGKLEVSGGDFSEKSNIKEEHWVEPTATPTVEVTPTPTPTVEVTPTPTPAVTPAPTPFVNKQVETEEDLRELFEIGGSGVLMANLDISETLNVPVDSVVTLDMNDKCISSASGSVDILIYNAGNLTLQNDVVNAYTLCDSGNGNAYLGSLVTNASTGIFTANKLVAVNETGNLIDNQGGQVVINEGLWDIWASRSSTGTVYGFNSNGGSIVINDVETEATRSKGLFYASNNAVITVNGGIFKARKDSNPAYLAVAEDSSSVVLRNNGQYTWEGASFAEVVQGNVINEGCTVTFHTSEPADPLPTLSVTASAVPAAENGMITVTEGENVVISVYPECSDTSVELSYVWKLGDETLSCTGNSYVFAPTLDQNGKTISVTVVTNKEVDVQTATTFIYTLNVQSESEVPSDAVVENFTWPILLNGAGGNSSRINLEQSEYLLEHFTSKYDHSTLTMEYSAGKGITIVDASVTRIKFKATEEANNEFLTITITNPDGEMYIGKYQFVIDTIYKGATVNADSDAVLTEKATAFYQLTVKEGTTLTVTTNYELLNGQKADMSYNWNLEWDQVEQSLNNTSNSYTFKVTKEHVGAALTIQAQSKTNPQCVNMDVIELVVESADPLPTLSVTASAVPADENGMITVTEGENVAISVYPECSDTSVELSYVWKLDDETLSCTGNSYVFAPTLDQNGKTISVTVVPSKEVDAQTATTFSYTLNVQPESEIPSDAVVEKFTWSLMLNGLSEKRPIDLGQNDYLRQNFYNQYAIADLTITAEAGEGISELAVSYTPMPRVTFAVNDQSDGEIITVTVVSKDGNTYIANYEIDLMSVVRKEASINAESGAVMTKRSDGDYEITVKEGTSLTVTANYELLTGGTPDMTYEWGFQANGLDLGGQTGTYNSYTFTVGQQHNNTTLEVYVENQQNPAEWDSIGFELSVEPADEPAIPTLSMTVETAPAAVDGKITVTEGENVAISVYPECSDTSVELSYVWKLGDETLSCTSNSYVFAPTLDQNGKTISVTVVTNKEVDVQNATTFVYTLNVKAKPETVTVETDSYMVPFNYTYTQEFIPQDLKDEIQQVFDAQTVTVDELNQKYSCAYEIDENHVNCFTIVNAAPQFEDREGTLVFPAFKFKPDYQNNYYQDAATITTTFTDNANNTVLYTEKNTVRYAKRGNPVVVSGTQNQVNGSELTVEEGAQVTLQSVFTDLDGNKLDMSYEWVIMYGYMGDDGKPAQEVLSSTTSTCTITVKPEYNGKMLTIGAYYKDKWVDNVPLKFIVLEQTPTLSVATNAVPADENGVITVTEGENVAISVNPTCSDSSVELSYVWKLGDETLSCTSDSYLFAPTLDQNGKTISVEVVPSKEVDAQTATTFSYLLSVQAKQNVQQITTYEQLKQLFAEGGTGEITLEPTFSNGVIWLEEPLTVPEGKTVKLQMNGCGIWTKRENETLIYNNGTLILENDTYTIDNLSDYGEALEWLVINNKTGVLEADDICAINEYGGLIQNNGGTVKLTQTNSSCWYTYETPRSGTSNYLFVNTDGGKMDITNTSTDVCIDAGAYYCSGEDSKITVSGGSCFMLGSSTEYMALAENGGTIELRDGVRYKWMDGKVSSGSVSISADCSGTLVPTLSTEEEIRQLFANGGEAVIQSEIQITSPLSVPENVKVQLRATRGSYGLVANAIALTEPLITNNGELELNTLKVFSNSTAGTIVNNGGATLNTDSANIQNMNTGCIINNGGTVKVSYGHVQSSAGAYVFENKGGEATISNATVVYEHDAESPTGGVFYADAGMITVKNIYFLHAPNVNPFTETCYLYDGHLLACTEENEGNISVRSIKNAITYCGTDEFGYYSGYGVTIDPSVNITLQ